MKLLDKFAILSYNIIVKRQYVNYLGGGGDMIVPDCEEWKPVVGYEELYEVSNLGRVLSLPRNAVSEITDEEKHRRGRLLKLNRHNNQISVCLV